MASTKTNLFGQLTRFCIVGLLAAAVHFSIVVLLVEVGALKPLIANIFAFLIAFQVSYWGHRRWTFHTTTSLHGEALPKLFLVNGLGFIANEGLFYIFMTMFGLSYPLALFLVLAILPVATFALGKFWVFRG